MESTSVGSRLSRLGRAHAKAAIVALGLFTGSVAHAGLISGFESGLGEWEHIGDVSIQTSAIGLNPTQAAKMAFVTTMCDQNNPPSQGGRCSYSGLTNEHPYSGISSRIVSNHSGLR